MTLQGDRMEKIFKVYKGIVKSVQEKDFTMDVIVSTSDVDRDREKINADAFKKRLKYYKDHPVLLSSHRYDDLRKQVGEATNVKVTEEGLEAKFKYYVGEGNPEADWAWVLAQKGIAGFSIGFIPFAYVDKDLEKDGYNREFTDVELVEISQVLVPSNRNAVQQRRDIVTNLNEVEKELLEVAIKQFDAGDLKEPNIEQKPKPQDNETEEHFMNRCIPMLIDEGRKPDQASAICHSLWDKKAQDYSCVKNADGSFTISGASGANALFNSTNGDGINYSITFKSFAELEKERIEAEEKQLEILIAKIIEKLTADKMFLKSLLDGMAKMADIPLSKEMILGMIKSALQPKESK